MKRPAANPFLLSLLLGTLLAGCASLQLDQKPLTPQQEREVQSVENREAAGDLSSMEAAIEKEAAASDKGIKF